MESFLARWMPPDASAHGPALDAMNAYVHWLMAVLFVGWGLYFVYVLFRFRRGRHPRASYTGTTSHVSTWTEGAVVVAEIVLLAGFSIPAWARWTTPPPPGANPLVLRVVGEQFAWNVHYPGSDGRFGRSDPKLMDASNPLGLDPSDRDGKDDVVTINQLHLPVDRAVTVRLTSKDVIHSFTLPVMRVKQDAIPGMEIPIHFTPVLANDGQRWEVACAQLCGLGHYRMRGFLTVHPPGGFEAWLAEQAPFGGAAAAEATPGS